MANLAVSIPSSVVVKKRGRKPNLSAVVEGATVKEPKAKKNGRFANVFLSEKNAGYLLSVKQRTGQSYNALLKLCVDNARSLEVLKSVPQHEPAAIRKAREKLASWDKKSASKK